MVIAGIVIGIVLILVLMYNSLINKKNQVENSFGGMDVQLKKRYDLIPNLISAVKTYMKHEADTLTEITELRTKALTGGISDNEKVDNTEWHNIIAWNKLAEFSNKYLYKGQSIYLEGKIHTSSWEDEKQGHKKTRVEIICSNIVPLEWNNSSDTKDKSD